MAIIPSLPRPPALVSFLPDQVGVFDSGFNQLFKVARPIRAFVREDSKLMEYPLEDGTVGIDHSIIQPIEIELLLILPTSDYFNTYQTIKQYFLSRALLTVQTKTTVYMNQIIYAMPHDETTEMYNTVGIGLRFREAQFAPVPMSAVSPENPTQVDTANLGQQQGTPFTPTQNGSVPPSALADFLFN